MAMRSVDLESNQSTVNVSNITAKNEKNSNFDFPSKIVRIDRNIDDKVLVPIAGVTYVICNIPWCRIMENS